MWKYFGCMIKLEIFMGVVRRYPSMMVADTRPSGYHILLMMLVLNWSQPTRQYGSLFELLWQHQRTWISLWMFSGSRFQYSLMMDESTRPLYIIIWRRLLAWWWWSKKTEQELTEYMLPLTCILLYYYSSNLFYYYSGQKKKDQDFTTLKKYQDTWWRQYTPDNQEGKNALWCQHNKTFWWS